MKKAFALVVTMFFALSFMSATENLFLELNGKRYEVNISSSETANAFVKTLSNENLKFKAFGGFEFYVNRKIKFQNLDKTTTQYKAGFIYYNLDYSAISVVYKDHNISPSKAIEIGHFTDNSIINALENAEPNRTITANFRRVESENKSLVIYYSLTETTATLANEIAKLSNADVFRLECVKPYSTQMSVVAKEYKNDRDNKIYRKLKSVPDLNKYDTIFIGTPVWGDDIADPLTGYLLSNKEQFKGKTVVPFVTWWSTQYESTENHIIELTKGAKHLEGFNLQHGVKNDVSLWLKKIGMLSDNVTKTVKLNSNFFMPRLGLGTWTLTGSTCENAVYEALKTGYRLVDTAKYYGNENEVGNAITRAIKDGIVKREELFITTKLVPWSTTPDADIDDSLKKLKLDYIDLVLLHQSGVNEDKVYSSMVKAVKGGKIRSIGISNFYTESTVNHFIKDFEIAPAVIQNENHIFYQGWELQKALTKNGIFIESYYPFGGRGHTGESFNNPVITKIAKEHKKTSAQIIVRWHLQSGFIAIPGSSNPAHIRENFNVFDFALSDSEMDMIHALNKNKRYENW